MDNSPFDILRSITSDYTTRDTDHFLLEQLDQYPGPLPFSLSIPTGTTDESASPSEAKTVEIPIRLDPQLAAEIAAEIEKSRKQRATEGEDPLARLEEQLASDESLHGSTSGYDDDRIKLHDDSQEIGDEPPSTPVDNHAEHEFQEVTVPTSESVSHRRKRKRALLLALAGLVVILGILLMLQEHGFVSMIKKSSDTTTVQTNNLKQLPQPDTAPEGSRQALQPTPNLRGDTTLHTPSPKVLKQRLTESLPNVSKAEEKPKETYPQRRNERSSPIKQPALRTQEQDITIVVPPSLPPPKKDATFVIQLCSTPSYVEALRWKRFVEERLHGEQVTITERSVREQTYFRVRVGAYRSQTEAQQAVRALGLSLADVWILQIE